MAAPADMIVPLLREIRAENLDQHEQTRAMIGLLQTRKETLEGAQASFRQALTADTVMSKLITGEFEERIEMLERKVRDLETHK
jgi:polyhydroxyalkanoate synthesis regulator phasin